MNKQLDQDCKQPDIIIQCPECEGTGVMIIGAMGELSESMKILCPVCKGEGKIKERI